MDEGLDYTEGLGCRELKQTDALDRNELRADTNDAGAATPPPLREHGVDQPSVGDEGHAQAVSHVLVSLIELEPEGARLAHHQLLLRLPRMTRPLLLLPGPTAGATSATWAAAAWAAAAWASATD